MYLREPVLRRLALVELVSDHVSVIHRIHPDDQGYDKDRYTTQSPDAHGNECACEIYGEHDRPEHYVPDKQEDGFFDLAIICLAEARYKK